MHLSIDESLQWWRAKVTGLTTNYSEAEIKTNLSVGSNIVAMIQRIEFYFGIGGGADSHHDVQVVRETQTDILNPDDVDLLAYARKISDFTTSGQIYHDYPLIIIYDLPIVYARPSIYFGAKPSATPDPTAAYCRIGWYAKKVSEKDFFKIAAQLTL